ncbi:MAG: TonB-dependent receptor [Chitinophagaceae bacterium]|nr:TonB-dependent receptor [Chitinophagaceae bacterium]
MTKMLRPLACLLFMFSVLAPLNRLHAQVKQITGTVTSSETRQPLAGVTVTLKGTRTVAMTDASGNYKITLPSASGILVFSSAGQLSLEIPVNGESVINATINPDVKAIEDVVVIGYQTVRRKDLLASVSSIGSKDLKDMPINSAEEALNGRLAGVTATTSEGSPDARVTIRIRGGMSITGDNSPLYIVDGVQVENGLSAISPQDIQSIDVLKDAAATAIYGARGGNGVIVITTKSGRTGKPKVTYNGFIGVKYLPKKLEVLSPYDFVIYQSERSRGSSVDSTNFVNHFGHTWDTLLNYKNMQSIDWQDEVFGNTGVTQTHNVGVSGGSKKLTYSFGYTYNNDKAIVISSEYKRHLLNLKTEYKINKNIKIGISGRLTHQDVLGAGVSDTKGSSYNRLRNAVKYRPFLSTAQELDDPDPFADPNVGNGLNLTNPILLANAEYRKKTTDVYNGTAFLSWNLVKNLSFKSTFGYDYNKSMDRQFYDSITPYAIIQGAAKPIAGLDTVIRKTITNSNVLTYTLNNYKDRHDFSVLVGEETYETTTDAYSRLYKSFPAFTTYGAAFKDPTLGTPFTGYPKYSKARYTNISFFGRVNYAYKDKYLFSANVRQDGASKFGPGHKWGTFPAGSIAWRVSREKFMENLKFINEFKVRAGYGEIGNNRIADYLYLTSFRNDGAYFYGINNSAILAYYSGSLVNPDLKWESTINRNLGFDITLFKRRLDITLDIYKNTSKDLLLNVPIASTYGYATQLRNIGQTENKGVEIQLIAGIIRKKDFTWNANFNISFNKNKVVKLGQNQTSFFADPSWGVSGQPADYIERIGDPVGSIWGLVTDGYYGVGDFDYNPNTGQYTLKAGRLTDVGIIGPVMPGSIKFKDLNGDGVIDLNNDRTIIGNPNPKFTGGLSQQITYKKWDISLFMNFSYGNDIYNANKIEFTNGYSNNSNMLKLMEGRWKVVTATGQTAEWVNGTNVFGIPPDQLAALNAQATIWQPLKSAGAFYPHSWAIEDGSFLRVNNLTIGYTFSNKAISSLKMSHLRVYLTGNNLALMTRYSGYDPEVSVRNSPLTPGLDYSAYPKSRSFIFGINASF